MSLTSTFRPKQAVTLDLQTEEGSQLVQAILREVGEKEVCAELVVKPNQNLAMPAEMTARMSSLRGPASEWVDLILTDGSQFPVLSFEVDESRGQSRQFVRIQDYLRMRLTPLPPTEYEETLALFAARTRPRSLPAPGLAALEEAASEEELLQELGPNLYRFLTGVDRKLVAILSALQYLVQQGVEDLVAYKVDISGAGVRFQTDASFEPNIYLEILIELPLSVPRHVSVLGMVTRVESVEGKAERGGCWVAIEFMVIDEEDREELIRYIFQRQREQLRLRRRRPPEAGSAPAL